MEQNSRSSLFLQVFRESVELKANILEEGLVLKIVGSYQNEKNDEIKEWISEANKIELTTQNQPDRSVDSFWCNSMILRIRELRAKRGPKFNFQKVRDVESSSTNMLTAAPPLSSCEEFYCEMKSLASIYNAKALGNSSTSEGHQEQMMDEMMDFFGKIKAELGRKFPETIPDWYPNKIAEIRELIAKCEPSLSLQPQHVGSASSTNIPVMALHSFHEELRCEIRLLNSLKSGDLIFANSVQNIDGRDKLNKQFHKWIKEVNILLTEINQQLKEKILEKDLNWYRDKIKESRTLIDQRYLAFPLRPQDVGYKKHYQIFISFRGEDTRTGITLNLYEELCHKGFNVFKDDLGIRTGDSIAQVLMKAIENTKLSIIVLSKNFADSKWCLDEVAKIIECKQKKNQWVWPIFYKVKPSDVDKAMTKQEEVFGKDYEKVNNWRKVLNEVYALEDAFHYTENNGSESDFIQSILEAATKIEDYL